jgi:transposase
MGAAVDAEAALEVQCERLGPLPLVNHFLGRLGTRELFERFLPRPRVHRTLDPARVLGVLLRSIIVEREPIYRQQETVRTFAPSAFGLQADEVRLLSDDAIGRALDRLFDADRGAMLTELVVGVRKRFGVEFRELHNDSTSIKLAGQYANARGRSMRGKRAPCITYGYSKDHRPDLKQLLFILTTSSDGGIPVQFRSGDGNLSDAKTHIETWETLSGVVGAPDFLYVADSKLCTAENMDYIDRRRGRFVTVLPRSRLEDAEFREWIQTHEPPWEEVWNRPNPHRKGGPRDIWRVFKYPIPSREAWPVIWVSSSLLALAQERSRRDRLARAIQELDKLKMRLSGPRPRSRTRVLQSVEKILAKRHVDRYLKVDVKETKLDRFKQEHPGRPGPDTLYKRTVRRRLEMSWKIDEAKIAYDRKSDGMYPLLTNDRTLTLAQVLEAHKRQPTIEKRFQQTKTVHEIAPVLLKNEGRIEALFFVYFVALLVQALIERDLRRAMKRENVEDLALYPEERRSRRPTSEQVLRLFGLAERHVVLRRGQVLGVCEPELTDLQKEILRLLAIPTTAYRPCGAAGIKLR